MTITEQHPTVGGGPSPEILCEPLHPTQIAALAQRAATRVRNPVTTEAPTAPWVAAAPVKANSERRPSGAWRVLAVGALLIVAGIAYLAISRSGPGPTLVDVPPTTATPTTVASEVPTTVATAPDPSTPADQATLPPSGPASVPAPVPVAPPVTQAAPATPPANQPAAQTPPTTNKKAPVPTTPAPSATPTTAAPAGNGNGNGNGNPGGGNGNGKNGK